MQKNKPNKSDTGTVLAFRSGGVGTHVVNRIGGGTRGKFLHSSPKIHHFTYFFPAMEGSVPVYPPKSAAVRYWRFLNFITQL